MPFASFQCRHLNPACRAAWGWALALALALAWALALTLGLSRPAQAFCFTQAAQRYGVNEALLRAIAKVESNNQANAVNTNADGSYDLGLMQINSRHFGTLAKYHITPNALLDPCMNVHVGAWVLAHAIRVHGPTWRAIGAYNAGGAPAREALREKYVAKVWRALQKQQLPSGGLVHAEAWAGPPLTAADSQAP